MIARLWHSVIVGLVLVACDRLGPARFERASRRPVVFGLVAALFALGDRKLRPAPKD